VKSFPAFGILFGSRSRQQELRTFLEKNSGLPGPRGNLELAHSFAASVAAMAISEWQWEFLAQLAATSVSKAPVNSAKEFLPFCATLALGALYGNGLPRPRRRAALAALTAAATDARWRMREAAAMGLQLVGERDIDAMKGIVASWLADSSWLTLRAVAAGLAHPPILKDPEVALYAVQTAATLVAALSRAGAKDRREEPFKILRQGLGYSLSVFAAASPGEGFALLRKCAAVSDPDLAWVVRENLKKKRISDAFSRECEQVAAIAAEAGAR
jgi:hypothetical protein